MPYYSVHITGGEDCESAGREARQTFNGTDADYTGSANFFYVQRNYDRDTLKRNVEDLLGDEYTVEVKKITRNEFFWRRT
jgi:hypothetical protein